MVNVSHFFWEGHIKRKYFTHHQFQLFDDDFYNYLSPININLFIFLLFMKIGKCFEVFIFIIVLPILAINYSCFQ